MQRNRTIIYIGTEYNPKTCLGLSAIVNNGWKVILAIAYIPSKPKASGGGMSDWKSKILGLYRDFSPTSYYCLRNIFRHCSSRIANLEKIYIPAIPSMRSICLASNIEYLSTNDKTLQTLRERIEKYAPAVILSNGWQFRIRGEIISSASLIALNCHSSYLPEYRGGNVTFAPLINEEKTSGVTVHRMIDKFDAGDILAQKRVDIVKNETPESLNLKRAGITGQVLCKALEVVGNPRLYKPNPPSPFYFRCNYSTFRRYKRINYFRKKFGMPIKRYNPKERYDI